jgi:polar amino acid transport system substrate-binding protein
MMKRVYAITLLVFLVALFSACTHQAGTGINQPYAPGLQTIQQKGELVVGTSGNQPPLTMTTKEGELIGLEVDLAQAIAAAMGVKLKLVAMPFSELLPSLEAGKIDMILSGMTMTPKRNLKVAFVGPYYVSGKGILTKRQKIATLQDTAEMDNPYTTIAALRGSTSQLFVEEKLPKAKLVPTRDYDEAVDMVIQDKADAFIADYPICVYSILRYPDKGLAALIAPKTYEPLGIALPQNDPFMINWLANFLNTLEGRGEFKNMKKRWFNNADWLKKLP